MTIITLVERFQTEIVQYQTIQYVAATLGNLLSMSFTVVLRVGTAQLWRRLREYLCR